MRLREALRLAVGFGDDDTRLAWTCQRLAWALFKAGKRDDFPREGQSNAAESLARRGQAILERVRGSDHIEVVQGLTNLATIIDTPRK